jgi:hypothetical protein
MAKDLKAFLQLARDRWAQVKQADADQDKREKDDLSFLVDPWPGAIRAAREGQQIISGMTSPSGVPMTVPPRPCISIDTLSGPIRSVVNQERAMDFGVEVVAADDFGELGAPIPDDEIKLREGLVRRIQRESEAQDARSWAFDRAVKCGRGYYGVMTRYVPGKTWDQEVVLRRFYNQAQVKLDPAHEQPDGSDAEWAMITSWMPLAEYRAKFPKALDDADNPVGSDAEFEADTQHYPEWFTDDGETRGCFVVEYFYTERTVRELALLADGSAAWADELPAGAEVVDTRPEETKAIKWAKIDGIQILEETDWPGRHIPVIKVLGEEVQPFDNQRRSQGIVRPAKESVQANNFTVSKFVEVVGLSSIPTVMLEEGQEEGHEDEWAARNTRTLPYVRYKRTNLEGQQANPPMPVPNETPVQPLALGMQIFGEAIKVSTNVPSATLGEIDPTIKSGRAIKALLQQAEQGTSNYLDNLTRSMRYEGTIVNDLLYPVYGKRPGRLARIVNGENEGETVTIGQMAQAGQPPVGKQYTLTENARFNVAIQVSKSYDTRREHAATITGEIIAADPTQMAVIGDLFMKNTDGPLNNEMAERYRVMLAPPVQALLAQQEAQKQGAAPIPPEVQAQLAQIPALQAQLQEAVKAIETDQVKAQAAQQQTAMKVEADLKKAELDAAAASRDKQAEIESKERIAALQAQTELAKLQATIDAQAAQAMVAAEHERTIEVMRLGSAAEQSAQQRGHEAEEKAKDRQLAGATKKTKTIQRGEDGRATGIVEESTVM